MREARASAAAFIICASALIGCGGGGGNDTGQIRAVLKQSADLSSPTVCSQDFTGTGLEQFFNNTDSVAAARKDCAANVGHSSVHAKDLTFGAIAVRGNTATALVTAKGKTARFVLVKQPGWKINGVSAA